MSRQLTFIGVTTGRSAMVQIFPRWRDLLGLGADVTMVGWDLPLHAPPARYRAAVEALKGDPHNLGALVTTHKVDLYAAARDLFDEVDEHAGLLGEVSSIARRDGRLLAGATDPISAGQALDGMLGASYFRRTRAHVLLFGVGGAGMAITLHLLSRAGQDDRPARIVATDRNPERLESLRALVERLHAAVPVAYVAGADPLDNDRLVADLPPGSLVINATGMGKDTPGSPVTDAARFPIDGIAWELNYRGELDFLRQARRQQESHGLRVEDGWEYFIHGWTAVIESVFHRPITPQERAALAAAAAPARPPSPTP